jgi:ABC-type sulfate transport system substrate-binding protein
MVVGCASFIALLVVIASVHSVRTRPSSDVIVVSYDGTHDILRDIAQALSTNGSTRLEARHGGSATQAESVARGIRADAVLLATELEIQTLVERGLVPADWKRQFPFESSPFASPIVFLVRDGRGKKIEDWGDLAHPSVNVMLTSPRVSGAGRLAYLAIYDFASRTHENSVAAEQFCRRLYAKAEMLTF